MVREGQSQGEPCMEGVLGEGLHVHWRKPGSREGLKLNEMDRETMVGCAGFLAIRELKFGYGPGKREHPEVSEGLCSSGTQ